MDMDNDMGSIFQQAKQLQSKIGDIQKELADKTVEVSTGGGMVKITSNGIHQILSIRIDDELMIGFGADNLHAKIDRAAAKRAGR